MNTTAVRQMVFAVLAACLLLPASAPTVLAVLQKSSKKECALCHVMWLDVFRTNKETLIEWQPGNVLMKDTQGIVSAEELCYSCHDGYIADERYSVWKGNNHPVFKKPSADIKIPTALTLSKKDELYCGTCHSPHSGREAAPGSSPEETIPGPMSFLKLPNVDSGMCEACHVNTADFKRTHGHPLHTDKLKIPQTLFAQGSVRAREENTVTCQTCHVVHGAKGRHMTVVDNRQSALCMTCHGQRTIVGTLHDARVTMPEEVNMHGQSASQAGPCSACHVPHQSAGYKLWARKTAPGNPAAWICLSCHGGAPDSTSKGIGRYSHPIDVRAIPNPREEAQPSAPAADGLPVFSSSGFREPGGTMQCFTCHAVHQWNPDHPEARGGKGAIGDATNSFLRTSASPASTLCVACHAGKRQLLSSDHNFVLTAPTTTNIRKETLAASGPCGACHIPHNAQNEMLWARALFRENWTAPQYCMGCHAPAGASTAKPVDKYNHPVDAVLKGSGVPPPDRVMGTLPLYNAQGGINGGTRIMCRTCHDPHTWSDGGEKAPPAGPPSDPADQAPTAVEGDAHSSFLRKTASPRPDLCVVCHPDTALLVGTDHDLFVTAPDATNRFDRTVVATGPCGACHAAHNSPEARLLWAQAYGQVKADQHPMDRLCTGCHAKGGAAADKIPPAATHPKGLLITNVLTSTDQDVGYIKIFDEQWEAARVGDLSCSSCHSFYRWDRRTRRAGPGRNVDGNAETSFLRASSDNTVCIDCHGRTAIWRYLYFHSLEKRKMIKGVKP